MFQLAPALTQDASNLLVAISGSVHQGGPSVVLLSAHDGGHYSVVLSAHDGAHLTNPF